MWLPNPPSPTEKGGVVKFLGDWHDSPDGRIPTREVLLAMYIDIAHHRGQAEIYLREKANSAAPVLILTFGSRLLLSGLRFLRSAFR
jgi:hypothetical protein